jgi:D-inositol-3-phosphate glycosyltransferase
MRILFANHTGSVSGAERALLRLLRRLAREHDVRVACPSNAPLASAVDELGIEHAPIPAFEASFRPHPVHTPAGMARLLGGGAALARSARRFRADVVYANTTRAALMGVVSRRLGGPPLAVRLHDHLPPSAGGAAVRSLIARRASAVLAVSDYTAERFNHGLARPIAARVYPGIDTSVFDPDQVAPAPLRRELGLGADALLIGQVAQITPWKGQDHAIRTLAALRHGGVDAHLVLIGTIVFGGKQVRYDNAAYLRSLHRLTHELGVSGAVEFLGQRDDVRALLRTLDLVLVPSQEEPFGLAALESLAMGTPAFVARAGGSAEIVRDGVTGRVLANADPVKWADAIAQALSDRRALALMGARARVLPAQFREETEAEEIAVRLAFVAGEARTPAGGRPAALAAAHPPARSQWPN